MNELDCNSYQTFYERKISDLNYNLYLYFYFFIFSGFFPKICISLMFALQSYYFKNHRLNLSPFQSNPGNVFLVLSSNYLNKSKLEIN